MTSSPASPGPAGFPAGPARWALLAGFAALTGIALVPLHPSPLAAALVAAGAITACALLVSGRSPRLLYGALAIAGITVLGSGQASQVGWFAVCLVGLWCGLAGPRRDAVIFLGAVLVLFITEWAWIDPDPGWAAWIAGSALSAVLGVLVRQQSELVTRLRQAQAGWPTRPAPRSAAASAATCTTSSRTPSPSPCSTSPAPASRSSTIRPTRPGPWPRPSDSAARVWRRYASPSGCFIPAATMAGTYPCPARMACPASSSASDRPGRRSAWPSRETRPGSTPPPA